MRMKQILRLTSLLVILFSLSQTVMAQNKTVGGRVTDPNGAGVPGVTVTVRGTNNSTQTSSDGTYRITAPDNATLIFTSVGYNTQELSVSGKSTVDVNLTSSNTNLNEVVVIGYGTARRRDVTGSIASVQAKDFNKGGVVVNPDQLLQGKVAGLQIVESSGQPGSATVVKIRGNNSIRSGNTPLYVVDGIPLDGRSPRPGLANGTGLGTSPTVNPLNFINPYDIASIDVLKDASAAAIYGSRGANGVIIVTTKKGRAGSAQIDVGANVGISNVMRRIKVLNASEYRSALKSYNAPLSDSGASVDPFGSILHKSAPTQNYTVSFGGGTENGRYRASFLYSDQQGIIRKSYLKKIVGSINGQNLMLDKKLSFDYNLTIANVGEQIAPITNDAGSNGNIISLGLIWNPTLRLTEANGLFNQVNPSGQINPLALSEAYNDYANTTTALGSVALGYKITPDLQYKLLYGINYGTGQRWQELQGWLIGNGSNGGQAARADAELFSQTLTHTLSYVKQITPSLNLNALAGYEYWSTAYKGGGLFATHWSLNQNQATITPNYHYYDNFGDATPGNSAFYSFKDPSVELQSYFARATINLRDKYILTATFRSDGSSKFGANNRYAYFPSFAAAWNITNEDFMKRNTIFNSLKLRVGYGITGNQEFNPVDIAFQPGTYNGGAFSVNHFGNPNLKWESVTSVDAGIDFGIVHNRVWGYVDYFNKRTNDPILDFVISQPTAGGGTIYKNLDGKNGNPKAWLTNKGFEVSLGVAIIEKQDFSWTITANVMHVKNLLESDAANLKSVPFIKNTGGLHGQGSSGAYAEVIAIGQPIDVFYTPGFLGFNNGIGQYTGGSIFAGNPNPSTIVGFNTDLTYKKFALSINMHGSFGNLIFNNTAMSVLNISNIIGGRNIASNLIGNGESTANAITPSSRYLESGDYMKLGNATVSYRIGTMGRYIKSASVYFSGYNLFVITKYHGFDPEVNVDKTLNGVPSLGIDYIGFPTARNFTLGVNFSL
ncbi:MAG: SusC/RagA family TonB-linked outer membrane protein [Flavisolibacter sp.]